MNANRIDVVAIGELLIDFTCLSADETGYPVMAAHPGGAPANFLAALSKFGRKTALIGKVGEDAFGKLLVKTCNDAGIATKGLIMDPEYFTTLAFVTLDSTGNREFSFARKPGADTQLGPEDVDKSLIDQAKVLHFGTLSFTDEPAASAAREAIAYAKSQGKLISCDPNLRLPLWKKPEDAKEAMLWSLNQADIVKISDNEVEFLFGLKPEEGAAYILKEFGCQLVYVTCGAEGCYYKTANCAGFVPSLKGITVKDTTGAGDIFGGSAMYKFLETGKDVQGLSEAELSSIVTFATAAAGLSTTASGGISSVPELEEVVARMN